MVLGGMGVVFMLQGIVLALCSLISLVIETQGA
jgi:hypothetical protein